MVEIIDGELGGEWGECEIGDILPRVALAARVLLEGLVHGERP